MRIDDYISYEEMKIIETLKDKSRMEQDEILGECKNGEL